MPAPEFLVELRRHVGHDKLWLPGVVAIVVRDVPADAPAWQTPEVLLVKNADSGAWTPVTGIVEPDEQLTDRVHRRGVLETADHLVPLTRGDLAGTSAAVGVLREPVRHGVHAALP